MAAATVRDLELWAPWRRGMGGAGLLAPAEGARAPSRAGVDEKDGLLSVAAAARGAAARGSGAPGRAVGSPGRRATFFARPGTRPL